MHFQISFSATILSLSLLSLSSSTPIANVAPEQPILHSYGVLLYRAFDPLDIFGPLEVLQALSRNHTLQLHLLSRTLAPVLSSPLMASMNPTNSSFFPTLLPTDTFASDPDIDVLIIPGGAGMRNPNMTEEIEYVRGVYPRLKYVVTVCTGSAFLARTGLLDGRRATTNKESWKGVVGFGPNVRWVSPARWIVDGNIWSSAGVTAGIDTTLEFVRTMYPEGDNLVKGITRSIEYEQHPQDWDPFSAMSGIPPQNLE